MPDRAAVPPITIDFQPLGRRALVPAGANVLRAAQGAGIAIASVCGGAGLCDSCRVRVVRGSVTPPSGHERDTLSADDLAAGYRLACQVLATGDTVFEIPVESLDTGQRLQLEWDSRIGDIDLPAHRANASDAAAASVGLAVDLGTTKIAAYLVDLATGQTLAADAVLNPQVALGEDVISRIAYADATPDGAERLHALVTGAVNTLADRLGATAGVGPDAIREVVIVGNTVMHHLACGFPVAQLGRAPYAPAVTGPLTVSARDLGLRVGPGVHVYLPPNLAGYVGADHVSALIAVGGRSTAAAAFLEAAPSAPRGGRDAPGTPGGVPGCTRLVVDIGTNTEISLVAGDRIVTCSCASGPAFEGAHISCGMRAAQGAIERVRIVGREVRWQTIGNVAPIGVCGSGVLDAVAELAVHGALDRHGGFRRGHPLVDSRGGTPVLVLASAAATGHNRELTLTRGDVTEIQLAKAAIRTGIDLLLATAGVREEAIDEVIVAGAFGSYIDLASARRIGMMPALPAGRFRQVGNAAGAGARMMLLSASCRREAEDLARRVEHVDLTSIPRFTEVFAASLGFRESSANGR